MPYNPFDDPDLLKTPKAPKALPKVTKEDVQAQQAEDADSTNSPLGHLIDYMSGQVSHVLDDTAGFFGDLVTEGGKYAWNVAKHGMQGPKPEDLNNVHIPGSGSASKAAHALHDKVIGPDTAPRSRGEQYAGMAARGMADVLPNALAAPEALGGLLLSGVGGGLGAGIAGEAFPGSELAPLIGGIIGGGAPSAGHALVTGVRNHKAIAYGMADEHYGRMVNEVIPELEGGGSLAHPKVNPESGARGPMQVMPETAAKPGHGIKPSNGTAADDVRVGKQLYAALLGKYDGDHEKALAAYNWGEGNVDKVVKKHGDDWYYHAPAETQHYVVNGMNKAFGPSRSTGQGSVPPISPKDMASAMNDPRAIGDLLDPSQPELDLEDAAMNEKGMVRSVVDGRWLSRDDAHEEAHQEWVNKNFPEGTIVKGYGHNIDEHGNYLDPQVVRALEDQDSELAKARQFKAGDTPDLEQPDVLTPAEHQEMDASVPDYGTPPEAVDARSMGQGADFPEQIAANDGIEPPQEPPHDGGEEPPHGGMSPEEKLVRAINETRPASLETKELVSQVRKNQAAKLAEIQARGGGLPEQLAALKGELPSADYESVAHHFSPEEVKTLENKINSFKGMSSFDKTNTNKALSKMLDPNGLKMPTEHELDMLADVFSPDLIKAIIDRQTGKKAIIQNVVDILGVPRSAMSSTDISAPARQGLLFVGRKEFWDNYPQMIKMFHDKEFYDAQMAEIKTRENYGLMRQGRLAVRDSPLLQDREEYFGSNIAEHMPGENIPVIGLAAKAYNKTGGAIIRGSDRAYSGFLRKLRADVFDTLIEQGRQQGIDWESNPHKVKALAEFINTSTGRGNLGKFENVAHAFSALFFAPRLMKARFDILNPFYYARLYRADPMIAKEAFKAGRNTIAFAGIALSLAVAGGATVEGDLRSADGLKIKIGNIRMDVLGGIQQYLHLIAEVAGGEKKTQSGELQSLTDGKYGHDTRLTVLERFFTNKFAPVPGLARDWLQGKDPTGQDFSWKKELLGLITPMDISDTISALKTEGPKAAWVALPAFLGMSLQTYAPREHKQKGGVSVMGGYDPFKDKDLKAYDPFKDSSLKGITQ